MFCTTAPVNTSRGRHELEEQREMNMFNALSAANKWLRARNRSPCN